MAVPRFDVPSPATRPAQAHASNENAGDTLAFQSQHRGERGDQNVWAFYTLPGRPSTGVHFLLGHWSTMGKDGYTHIVRANGKGTRRLTTVERRMHKRFWSYSAAMRCRKPNGQAPVTIGQALIHGKHVDFQIIPELKDRRFGRFAVARAFVAAFELHDYACWPKALANMSGAKAKVQAFGQAGVTLALIGGTTGQAAKRAMVRQARSQPWPYQPHEW
jgi:hypothetical protein